MTWICYDHWIDMRLHWRLKDADWYIYIYIYLYDKMWYWHDCEKCDWYTSWMIWYYNDDWKCWWYINNDECPQDNMKVYDTWEWFMNENEQKQIEKREMRQRLLNIVLHV